MCLITHAIEVISSTEANWCLYTMQMHCAKVHALLAIELHDQNLILSDDQNLILLLCAHMHEFTQ